MAGEKTLEDVVAMVEAMQAQMDVSDSETQSEPNRYAVEREARKAESELKRFSENDGRSGNPRPTSPRRAEQLTRSVSNLPPPVTPARPVAAPASKGSGTPIEIVVVDNGEFKTGNFLIEGELTAVI